MTDLQLFTTAHQRTASAFSTSRLSILEVDQEQKLRLNNLLLWQADLDAALCALNHLVLRVKKQGALPPQVDDVVGMQQQLVKMAKATAGQ